MLFPLRSGLHTQMHPSPFSGRPSNFSFTICQSKPHFCAKSLAWKERHESQVVDLSDQAWLQDFYQNLSLASNGSQTGSKKWHMHFQLSGNQWLSSPHITACQLIQASKPHSIFSSYHKYTIQRKKEKQLRTSSLFHPFPATLLPLAPAQTAMCQHLALPPVAVSGVAGATATNQGIGLWQPIIITANACTGCCACFAFGKGCTTGCTTGFGKGFGCTAFGGGAAAASLGLNSEKMWKESAGARRRLSNRCVPYGLYLSKTHRFYKIHALSLSPRRLRCNTFKREKNILGSVPKIRYLANVYHRSVRPKLQTQFLQPTIRGKTAESENTHWTGTVYICKSWYIKTNNTQYTLYE